jgi:hypothetical protein
MLMMWFVISCFNFVVWVCIVPHDEAVMCLMWFVISWRNSMV